ncbi:MAG: DUF5652 family protein [Candidatus Moranbacteria bacterium]|nr:DUF5652 family protein [Candidatus Moranbacteria bacterium]
MSLNLTPIQTLIIILTAIWTIPWKGWALWKAAKKGDKIWFIVLLIVNTLGILEIIYIFIFSREQKIMQAGGEIGGGSIQP